MLIAISARGSGRFGKSGLQTIKRNTVRLCDQNGGHLCAAGCFGYAGSDCIKLMITPDKHLGRPCGTKMAHFQTSQRSFADQRAVKGGVAVIQRMDVGLGAFGKADLQTLRGHPDQAVDK